MTLWSYYRICRQLPQYTRLDAVLEVAFWLVLRML